MIAMIVLMLLAAAVFPLLLGLVFSATTERLEQRAFRRLAPRREVQRAQAILLALTGIMLLSLIGDLVLSKLDIRRVPASLSWIGWIIMCFSWSLHSVPGHSRVVKYLLFAAGSVLASSIHSARQVEISETWTALMCVHLVLLATGLFIALFAVRPDNPLTPGDPSSARTIRWHRAITWFQGPDVLSGLVWAAMAVVGLGSPYLLIRFAIKHRMAASPIVYLRSFHMAGAAQVFGLLVCPAVYRSASITGLVHRTQSSTSLQRAVPFLWRSNFRTISDEEWRGFIESEVQRAMGVIVDVSETSDSVRWELEVARKYHPAERILIVHSADTEGFGDRDGRTVSYDLHGIAAAYTREQIQSWTQSLVMALASQPLPMLRIQPPRWQLPVMALLYVVIGIPMGLSAFTVQRYKAAIEEAKGRVELQETGRIEWEAQQRAKEAAWRHGLLGENAKLEAPSAPVASEPSRPRGENAKPPASKCTPGDPLCEI